MVQPFHGLAGNFPASFFDHAFVSFLGRYQERNVFSRSHCESLFRNERNIYQPFIIHAIYAGPCFTFVSFVTGVSKRFSDFWDQSQALYSNNKRNRDFLFSSNMHTVCFHAHCIYGRMAHISNCEKTMNFFRRNIKIINTNV